MTRRTDPDTADKISLALLTRAAFGTESGLRNAMLSAFQRHWWRRFSIDQLTRSERKSKVLKLRRIAEPLVVSYKIAEEFSLRLIFFRVLDLL